ncbi:NAD(P)-dependent dehydrogenase, short-chain alcohol dehydrogenase family [Dyadobacter koreensis]|uniref:NAD(P)-dependent dehydrogenase, short-chain alcohol dehydrogenase family n=1 Tax=Dyadobacter koreensis TaxID=408657 RepID=A0A1H6XUY5_9BACT|nr:SDR family oxidoreductase [Dyadobacter koreensis]SEJ31434.1 NAD(P)-dependent dehydrogenase, short-chain alcohol dehydrogenase family [Dyadobacter koreensis]
MSTQKVAFISGANRGIGFETAKKLGRLGIFPVIGSRNESAGKEAVAKLKADGIEADSIIFDVNNKADYSNAYNYFESKFGKLDILVNNAGVSLEGDPVASMSNVNPTTEISEETLRGTLEANFFAQVFSTQVLLPLIRKSEAGRIVNVSSRLGSLSHHSDPASPIYPIQMFAYNTSKTALNAFTVHLAYELKDTAIKVNSAHPGWVQTELGGSSAPVTPEDGAETSVRLATIPADGPTGGFFYLDDVIPW